MSDAPDLQKWKFWAITFVLSSVTSSTVWYYQQKNLQNWSARPYVEVTVNSQKELTFSNVGTVDLVDLSVDVTTYSLELELDSHGRPMIATGIASASRRSSPVKLATDLAAGTTISRPLSGPEFGLLIFPITDPDPRASRDVYALRIVFRHGVSKQKFVLYEFASPTEGPNFYGLGDGAIAGPMEGLRRWLNLRDILVDSQMRLFNDRPSDRY